MTYQVIDRHTGAVVRTYAATRRRMAYALADRLDLEYGAVRYAVRPGAAPEPHHGAARALAVGAL